MRREFAVFTDCVASAHVRGFRSSAFPLSFLPSLPCSLFPYHLSEYVCRVQRTTPFAYYTLLLVDMMRDDCAYDALANFAAADAVRTLGVGRNEYIAAMVQAKSKRLLWRMNRGAVREFLPQQPMPLRLEPWWRVHVVNIGATGGRGERRPACQWVGFVVCGEEGGGGVERGKAGSH